MNIYVVKLKNGSYRFFYGDYLRAVRCAAILPIKILKGFTEDDFIYGRVKYDELPDF